MDDLSTNPNTATIVSVLGGLLLLLLGRKLFWIFVGVIGFVAGMRFGADLVGNDPEWLLLVVAVVVGLVAALLAVFLQRFAVAVAGGVAGGMLATQLALAFGAAEPITWIAFIVGFIIAAVLVSMVFDWALILISSLLGAVVIADAFQLGSPLETVVILGLTLAGVLVQASIMRRGTTVG